MNYIRQLNTVIEKFAEDDRLNPSHVSMYLGLFSFWNANRFENPISISRTELMKITKIGSRTTYLKCLQELTAYGYIHYYPSKNPLRGSKVEMFNFCTTSKQPTGQLNMSKKQTSADQDVGSSLKSNKSTKSDRLNSGITHNKNYDEPL